MTHTGSRPTLGSLALRTATPPKIYQVPTWSRIPREDGRVEYTISVPTRFGGRLFVVESFDAYAIRSEVADRIRAIRRVLWGRDHTERAAKPTWSRATTEASPATAAQHEPIDSPHPKQAPARGDNPATEAACPPPPWESGGAAGEASVASSITAATQSSQDNQDSQSTVKPQSSEEPERAQMTLF